MAQYMLNTGKQLENVVIPGMVCQFDKNEDKYETLLLWAIKGQSNKSYLNSFLQGKQCTLRKNNNSYSEVVGTVIGGKELSFINSTASTVFDGTQVVYGNTYKLSNVILVPKSLKTEEDIKKFLFSEVSQMIADKYPIPLEAEWKEYFIELIQESSIKELTLVGNLPYSKAYYVDINANEIGGALSMSFGRQQFIDRFKRAPQIKSLWKMINPDKFNVKAWQDFLTEFNGKDGFESIDLNHQETLVYLFEVFSLKAKEIRALSTEHKLDLYAIPFKAAAISIAKGELSFEVEQAAKAIKIVLETVKTQRHKALAINGLIDSLGTLDLKTLNKKPRELISTIQGVSYKPQLGAEGVAMIAAELWLSEDTFRKYQDEYLRAMPKIIDSSRTYPTVSGKLEGTDYSFESMDMGNPRGWFVGLETNCCQHLGSAGASCVRFAAANPKVSGMFRVMKKGETVAQSWFWYNESKGDFVFDNVEILGGELRDSIFDCYMKFIEEELKPRALMFGYKRFSIGLGYNDMPRLNSLPKVDNPSTIRSLNGGNGVYSDASSQVLLATVTNESN